jgi:arginyl-tRNA synthetase
VVSAVGRDIVRFIMLSRKNDVSMDFDLQKVQEQSKDNPVFYVQYANARAHSVWVAAQGAIPAIADKLALVTEEMLARLIEPHEMVLIRLLAFWPRFVENAAIHHEPHRITFYLQDLSAEFHSMWNKGREDKQCRMVIEGDEGLTIARLALVRAVALVIESGFKVIGVTPIYAM